MPLLSLCMIVKDEEQCLIRCLESVKDVVDEIIIVDTGSVDKTVKIAEYYTDHVYHFQWTDDFAAARNASINRATGTWILILDADEYLEPEDGHKLRSFLQNETPVHNIIYSLPIISLLGTSHNASVSEAPVDRILPNHMGIYYYRPIHEQLAGEGVALQSIATSFRIRHSGYTEETLVAKNKHERNLSIFKQLKDKQGKYSAYDHLMIGNQYLMKGDYTQATPHIEQALKEKHELGSISYQRVLFSYLQLYLNTQRFIDAWNFMDKYMRDYDSYPDIQAIRGILYYHLGFYRESKDAFLRSLHMSEESAHLGKPHYIMLPTSGVKFSLHYLSSLFEREKNFGEAVSCLTKLYNSFPDVEYLSRLIRLLALHDETPAISSFLGKLLNLKNPITIPLLCKISILQGHVGLSQYYESLMTDHSLLNLAEQLRFSLLINDRNLFQRFWEAGTKDEQQESQAVYHLVLAAVLWKQPIWLQLAETFRNSDSHSFALWAKKLLSDGLDEELQTDQDHTYSLLSGLYTIHHLDRFDEILELVRSSSVLNRIANLFYTLHQDDAAMQCYTFLNECSALNYHSCSNLSDILIRKGDEDTAIKLLEQAIQLQPQEQTLYVRYCTLSSNSTRREVIKRRLLQLNPHYKYLPPFMSL